MARKKSVLSADDIVAMINNLTLPGINVTGRIYGVQTTLMYKGAPMNMVEVMVSGHDTETVRRVVYFPSVGTKWSVLPILYKEVESMMQSYTYLNMTYRGKPIMNWRYKHNNKGKNIPHMVNKGLELP